jgi:hypothetical protein
MPPGKGTRLQGILLVLALSLLAMWAILDLSTSDSTLRSLWRRAVPAESRGERLRDDVLDRVRPRG